MKLEIWTNSGANIHSENRVEIDLEDLGYTEEEWSELSDVEKDREILSYCWETEMLQYGFNEIKEGK